MADEKLEKRKRKVSAFDILIEIIIIIAGIIIIVYPAIIGWVIGIVLVIYGLLKIINLLRQ